MQSMHCWNDLRFGSRAQWQTPVSAAAVIVTLALGIAANTLAFSLLNSFFLRPLPVRQPHELVRIYANSPGGMQYFTVSHGDYLDIRDLTGVFSDVVLEEPVPLTVGVAGAHERVWGERVSDRYFSLLGVSPTSGRLFSDEDHDLGSPPVVVIAHRLWRRAFGGRDAIGETLVLNGRRMTVIGVAAEGFHGTHHGVFPDLWVPVARVPAAAAPRGGGQYFVIARLRAQVAMPEARAALDLLAERLERTHSANRGRRFSMLAESHGRIHPLARRGFLELSGVFIAVTAIVLFLACMNVSGILLAQAISRRREIAVRLALGATPRRLVRQLLIEYAGLAAVAAVLGVALAWFAATALAAMPLPTARGAAIEFDLGFDRRVLGFSIAITALTVTTFGLAPAVTASRADLLPILKNEAAAGLPPGRLRDALVAAQVMLSLVVLTSGGLFLRSLEKAHHIDLGFEPDGVMLASVDLTERSQTDRESVQVWPRLVERLKAIPHVRQVTLADRVPLELNITVTAIAPEGQEPTATDPWPSVNYAIVDRGYFETLGIPLLGGREFTDRDLPAGSRVAVVNDVLARRFWPGASAVGRRFVQRDGAAYEVVGVARSVKYLTLGEEPTPYVYFPLRQTPAAAMTVLVRTSSGGAALLSDLRQATDGIGAVYNVGPMADRVRLARLPATSAAAAMSLVSVFSLVLTAVGLYGTVAYAVSRRTHEVGVRRALGAQRSSIIWLVLRKIVIYSAAGIAAGSAGALITSRALGVLLYDVDSSRVTAVVIPTVVIAAVCAIAAAIPAARAASIEPATALRRD